MFLSLIMPIFACNQCTNIVHNIRKTNDISKQQDLFAELGKVIYQNHNNSNMLDAMCKIYIMNIEYHKKDHDIYTEKYYKSKDDLDRQYADQAYTQVRNQYIMLAQCYIEHNEFPGINEADKNSWINNVKYWWQKILG